jgi:hypothetical protein
MKHVSGYRRSSPITPSLLGAPALWLLLLSSGATAGTESPAGTYFGYEACAAASGSDNTCIGVEAGYSPSASNTGSHNTLLGTYAGSAITTGGYNVFAGRDAGTSNNVGHDNVFVGSEAGVVNTSGYQNTFVGSSSGESNAGGNDNVFAGYLSGALNSSGYYATYVGSHAGYSNTSGQFNTALGTFAGYGNTSGSFNTFLGAQSGQNNVSGSLNVFIGNAAGYTETGSNKLYIDNCLDSAPCTTPLIYGEFDTGLLRIGGVTHVHTYGASKSQLHFSLNNTDTGGFLTSVLDNNFFMSSGARYSGSSWVQRSPDQQSVIQGSGSLGYRIFTSSGHAVNATFTPTTRLLIDYNGLFALNANATVSGHEIHTSSGAYLTTTGVWTNASSREYKDAIAPLSADAAEKTLAALEPVTFHYKNDVEQQRVGFIAEDVPELVAMKDRKGLSPMDIVAVLTKVAQEQKQQLADQALQLADQARQLARETQNAARQEQELQAERSRGEGMEKQLAQLVAEVESLKARSQ